MNASVEFDLNALDDVLRVEAMYRFFTALNRSLILSSVVLMCMGTEQLTMWISDIEHKSTTITITAQCVPMYKQKFCGFTSTSYRHVWRLLLLYLNDVFVCGSSESYFRDPRMTYSIYWNEHNKYRQTTIHDDKTATLSISPKTNNFVYHTDRNHRSIWVNFPFLDTFMKLNFDFCFGIDKW